MNTWLTSYRAIPFYTVLIIVILLFREFAARSDRMLTTVGVGVPFLISDASIERNLDSSDKRLVVDSLGLLARRKDPSAMNKASELLNDKDLWVFGAIYLGRFDDATAVPYLIKALEPRYNVGLNIAIQVELQNLTGQKFGQDFHQWHDWYLSTYPASPFDFGV